MPKRTSYAQGTPNWVDLQTTDQEGAKAFYAGLFGWTYDDQPMPQGPVYSMARIGQDNVAVAVLAHPGRREAVVLPGADIDPTLAAANKIPNATMDKAQAKVTHENFGDLRIYMEGSTDQLGAMTFGSLMLKPGMAPHPPHENACSRGCSLSTSW